MSSAHSQGDKSLWPTPQFRQPPRPSNSAPREALSSPTDRMCPAPSPQGPQCAGSDAESSQPGIVGPGTAWPCLLGDWHPQKWLGPGGSDWLSLARLTGQMEAPSHLAPGKAPEWPPAGPGFLGSAPALPPFPMSPQLCLWGFLLLSSLGVSLSPALAPPSHPVPVSVPCTSLHSESFCLPFLLNPHVLQGLYPLLLGDPSRKRKGGSLEGPQEHFRLPPALRDRTGGMAMNVSAGMEAKTERCLPAHAPRSPSPVTIPGTTQKGSVFTASGSTVSL